MPGKTFNQVINSHEVSLAIERFLIAPYPQAFTAARVDISSPPAGFMDLGAVVEDSPSVKISRETYKLELGIPRQLAFETLVSVSGTVEFSVYSNSFWHSQFALGNYTTLTTVTTIASGAVFTQYFGTNIMKEFTLLGVADFINGSQVIHEFSRCAPSAEFTEQYRPNEASRIPFSFNAKAVVTTIGGCQQLTIGKRHYINGLGELCTSP